MKKSARFINRELSWLRFNERVLLEGDSASTPLLQRAGFLGIVAGNLDEFFMVRVGKLERKTDAGLREPDLAGLTPAQQLHAIRRAARGQMDALYRVYSARLLPHLAREGIHILRASRLSPAQRAWASGYFDTHVMPVLTPRLVVPTHPFPLLAAKRIYLAVLLRPEDGRPAALSLVAVPPSLPRLVLLPMGQGRVRGILLEEMIAMHVGRLFPGAQALEWMPFRITRNTDFVLDIDDADNLIQVMTKSLARRNYGKVVRLEVPQGADGRLLTRVCRGLGVGERILFSLPGPLDLRFLLREVAGLPGFDALRYPAFEPAVHHRLLAPQSIFHVIREGDLFFHHPYDSFDPVLRFVREAAEDPGVLAIKQTLYRISSKSVLVPTLARAAYLGKQVTVLVEVRARFDEENNIKWCKTLEAAGCHVLYGVPEWKTHSKVTLVVRREAQGMMHYVHIGTGNYNDITARQYTDMGLMTCDRQIGADAGAFFNRLTGYSHTFPMQALIASPDAFREAVVSRLHREMASAAQGLRARFTAKMNSLSDPAIIQAIYQAADAGVEVRLLVRGICCLSVAGRDNIRVQAVVGRFLEHARVYVFENAGEPEVFISSADLMPRNLDKRVELTAPIKDASIRGRILDILRREWDDTGQTWRLTPGGQYARVEHSPHDPGVQQVFMQLAQGAVAPQAKAIS